MRVKRHEDEHDWLESTAEFVKNLNLPELAEAGLYEYLVEMGNSERKGLESQVVRLIMHLLKFRYQPAMASNSWKISCVNARQEIRRTLKHSPSLQRYLLELLSDDDVYEDAREAAEEETSVKMPRSNPFKPEEIMDKSFFG
jgi:hypothetical protein